VINVFAIQGGQKLRIMTSFEFRGILLTIVCCVSFFYTIFAMIKYIIPFEKHLKKNYYNLWLWKSVKIIDPELLGYFGGNVIGTFRLYFFPSEGSVNNSV